MDEEQLFAALVKAGRMEEAHQVRQAIDSRQPETRTPQAVQSGIRFLRGATSMLPNLATNLMNVGGSEEDKQAVTDYRARQEAMYDRLSPDAGKGWETAGEVTSAILSGGSSGLLKGAMGTAERLGTLATEGGMFGGMAPAETGAEMAQNVGIGTVAGGAIPAAASGIAGAARPIARTLFPVGEAGALADKFARARGLPIRGEDVIESGVVRGSGRYLDALDVTNRRRHDLETYKTALTDEFGSGKDMDQLMSELGESYTRTYKGLQSKKQQLYKNAYESTGRLGDVDAGAFRQKLAAEYEEQVSDLGADSPGAKELEKWLGYGDGNVKTWHNRLKEVSRSLRKAGRSTDPNTVDANVLGKIQRGLNESIEQHAGQNNEWRVAQDFYKKSIVPYKEDAFGKLIRKGQTEKAAIESVNPSVTRQTNDRADRYWSSLDAEGKDTYREALMGKMLDQGSSVEIPFSSARASSYLDATEKRLAQKYIGKDERAALDGWKNLLRVSQFAGESAARSRTGSSIVQSALPMIGIGATGYMASPAAAAVIALAPAVPALVARSKAARTLLAKISTMKPEHPDYESTVRQLLKTAQASGVSAGATD